MFFRPIFHSNPHSSKIKAIFASGTVPSDYIPLISQLTTIPLTIGNVIRASYADFAQREIKMFQHFVSKGGFTKKGLGRAIDVLGLDETTSVVIFMNSRVKAKHAASTIEEKLNVAHLDTTDVILMHGELKRLDKFWKMRLFNRKPRANVRGEEVRGMEPNMDDLADLDFRVFVSTSAANVGIDKSTVRAVFRYGFMRDLLTFLQERGRGSRVPGEQSECHLFLDLATYSINLLTILSPAVKNNDDVEDAAYNADSGFNSALSPLAKKAAAAAEFRSSNGKQSSSGSKEKARKKNSLKPYARMQLRQRQLRELDEVLRFTCLDNGCQHTVTQWYLSTGRFELPPPVLAPCGDSCPICTGNWHRMHLPVYRSSVVEFLCSSAGASLENIEMAHDTHVSDALVGNVYYVEKVFDRAFGGVSRAHIDALFMSLKAAGILTVSKRGSKFVWGLTRSSIPGQEGGGAPLLVRDELWRGINLHEADRVRKRRDEDTRQNVLKYAEKRAKKQSKKTPTKK